jgi:hypothetical protein
MTVKHIEIDQIGKDKAVIRRAPKLGNSFHPFDVVGGRIRISDAAAGENVADFPIPSTTRPASASALRIVGGGTMEKSWRPAARRNLPAHLRMGVR